MKKLSLILICVIAALYVMAEDRFYINDFSIDPGETKQVEIMLDNTTVFTAIQADIYLPQGLTIEQEDGDFLFDLTDRKGRDHTISSTTLSSGAIRILIASQNLKTFSGNSGALVTFNISADQSISGNKVIELKNVIAGEVNQTEHQLPNTSCNVTIIPPVVLATGISLNKNELSLEVGATETLVATVTPSNVTNGSVTWTSSNNSVATVNSSGLVTAISAGTATITAKTADGTNLTATCQLTVNNSVVIGDFDFMVDGIAYNINSDGTSVTVTYTDSSDDFANNYAGLVNANIPATVTYQGTTYTVKNLAQNAFRNCGELKTVVLPNSIKFISSSFLYSTKLESVTLGNAVTTINNSAFNGCTALKSISLPNTVTTINDNAFNGCSSLATATLGTALKKIGKSAFSGCASLTSVNLPATLQTIGDYAFNESGLTTIEIPGSVTAIGYCAFRYCSDLYYISVDAANTKYDSRNYCNALIETQTNKLLTGCKVTVIPTDVTSLDDYAFARSTGLKQIVIPASVQAIGTRVFDECSGLNVMNVAANNTVYDSRNNCNAIIETATNTLIAGCKRTNIPADIITIGNYAFCGHSGLTSINIPVGLTSIGERAFKDCTGLTDVVIPNSVTSIVSFAFVGCTNLENLTISSSMESIGRGAFYNCTALQIIVSNITSPKNVLLGSDVFKNVDHETCVLYVPGGTRNIYMTSDQWKEFEIIKVLGDVNDDGNITAADITAIYNNLLNNDETYITTIDVNGDGVITSADVTFIYNILLGN